MNSAAVPFGVNHLKALFSPISPAEGTRLSRQLLESVSQFHSTGVSRNGDIDDLVCRFSDTQLPSEPISQERYTEYLLKEIIPYSTNMYSSRCIGHMTCAPPDFLRPIANIISILNQNVVKKEASRVFTLLERQTIGVMHRLAYGHSADFYEEHVQCDQSTLGIMASGGTLANLSGLWIARNTRLGATPEFAGVEEDGIAAALEYCGYTSAVVIGSSLMHYSIDKAAGVLGLGSKGVLKIPVDARRRIDVGLLSEAVASCKSRRQCILAIVGVAGTTDCGSIDPLVALADIAADCGAHFHVDAAWCGPLVFSERLRWKLAGLERADSITVDAHKQLYVPIGNSVLLLKNPAAAAVIQKQTRYMLQEDSGDLGKRCLEGSRPSNALLLHAVLHIIGSKGYDMLLQENIRKAHFMVELIASRPEFELLIEPETNIVLYRYIPGELRERCARRTLSLADNNRINRVNTHIQNSQCKAGRTFVSRTTVDYTCGDITASAVTLRAVIANPLTTEHDLNLVLEDQLKIAEQMVL